MTEQTNRNKRATAAVQSVVASFPADPPLISPVAVALAQLADQPTHIQKQRLMDIATDSPVLGSRLAQLAARKLGIKSQDPHRLNDALDVLGVNHSRVASFTTVVENAFARFDIVDAVFFQHCRMTALATRCVASFVGNVSKEDAYVAGLLHDIGQIAMRLHDRARYDRVLRAVAPVHRSDTFCEAEMRHFGFDHSQLGSQLLRAAGMSDDIVDAIAGHHDPFLATRSQNGKGLAATLAVADWLTHEMGYGAVPTQVDPRSPSNVPIDCVGADVLGIEGKLSGPLVGCFWSTCDEWDDILN